MDNYVKVLFEIYFKNQATFRFQNQSIAIFIILMFCFIVFQEAEDSLNSLTWAILVTQVCTKDSFVLGLLGMQNLIYLPKNGKSIKD